MPFGQWHPTGAVGGGGLSYRQLRSLRSLAGGYDCIALRADVTTVSRRGLHVRWRFAVGAL